MEKKSVESDSSHQVDFGDRRVSEADKPGLVRDLFDRVSRRYDLMNDLMSGGVHRLWKHEMLAWLAPKPGMTVLDVAGGTGDIAFRILDRIGGPEAGDIIVCDLSFGMVEAGRTRAWDRGIVAGIQWTVGDAEALPFAARSVDAYTVAFGLRNVTHIERALGEAHRVLRPGGRFLCLEFSSKQLPGLSRLYDLYSYAVIPAMGQMVAGDRQAYRYLVDSIRRFPPPERFAEMIHDAGFGGVRWRALSGGIAALHSAWRT